MTNFTPGPWFSHFEPTLNRHVVRAGFAGEQSICVTYGAGAKSYEAAANANLIAAAPELLEEIRKEITWLRRIRKELEGVARNSILLGIEQAIKGLSAVAGKAEGNS